MGEAAVTLKLSRQNNNREIVLLLKNMKEKDLKRAYNNVMAQTISASHQHLFAGNMFGDIFALR